MDKHARRAAQRAANKQAIEHYLANGGQITKLPAGGANYPRFDAWHAGGGCSPISKAHQRAS